MRTIRITLKEIYFGMLNLLLLGFFVLRENWMAIVWSAVASIITIYIGGFLQIFGGYNPGSLMKIFSMELFVYSVVTDSILAFIILVVMFGMYKRFEIEEVGSFEQFEGMDSRKELDLDFGISFFLGLFLAIIGLIIEGFIGGKGIILPILALFITFICIFDSPGIASIAGMVVGFLSTLLLIFGVIHGWLFPWAIVITRILKLVVVPWYKKGFNEPRKKVPILH